MLALAHVLAAESLADRDFLDHYCTGYDRVRALPARSRRRHREVAEWASAICGMPADDLAALARRMAARRTLVTVSWSLQRIRHGEQAPWMGLTLAAMLGPDRASRRRFRAWLRLDERSRVAGAALPACRRCRRGPTRSTRSSRWRRSATCCCIPASAFDYNGAALTYPDIRLVYWAGGNPFHHHQNIPRLRRALGRPDTVVVHDPYWTAMAKHADIVVPSTTAYERDDYSGSRNDPLLMAMPRAGRAVCAVPRRLHDIRRRWPTARVRRRSSPRAAPPREWLRTSTTSGARRTGFRGADVRRVLGDGQAAAARPRTG